MAEIAVLILGVVDKVREIAKDIEGTDRQASRLLKRVTSIEAPLLAVKHGTKLSSSESLRQLLATVEKAHGLLAEYTQSGKITRALKRNANADKFRYLSAVLTEGMQALQLDVAVDTWVKEDATDRLDDLEHMMKLMEEMEHNRRGNHNEVMVALKELRDGKRSEQKGWVEINYDEELDFERSIVLGSGRFGTVRTSKWRGADVAVKYLMSSGLSRDAIRTLRKEIRIHASLRFDFVVHLYAASTVSPHLCLVMELAPGGSLQQYLRSESRALAHALQVAFLLDVARGMWFLHGRGILHRDLKSANVLIFANYRLKLCDFGLSKIKVDSSSRSTRGAVGTLQWMSPEEMYGNPATELTDVYSFGVLCFEVATRGIPFPQMNPPQVIMAVSVKKQRPQIPEGSSPSADVVPLMKDCWTQEPHERPKGFRPIVQTLSQFVGRCGDPREHRARAGEYISLLAPISSIGGDMVSVGGNIKTPSVSGDVDTSSNDSSVKFQMAGAVSGLVPDMRVDFMPSVSRSGVSVPEGDVSPRATEGIGKATVPAAMPSGEVVGLDAPSVDLQIAGAGGISGSTEIDVGGSTHSFKKSNCIQELGEKFDRMFRDNNMVTRRIEVETPGSYYSPSVVARVDKQAKLLYEQGKYEEAASLYDMLLIIYEEALGKQHPSVSTTLSNRAGLLSRQGKYDEAQPLFERALAIRESALGMDHPDTITSRAWMADLYEKQRLLDKASPLLQDVLSAYERVHGPDHPNVASALNNLARLLADQGRYDDAGPLYLRATKIWERVHGREHPLVATALNNRALLLQAQGKYEEAAPLYHRIQEILRATVGREHPNYASTLNNRAELLEAQGRYAAADLLYQQALAINEKVLGPDHPNVAGGLNNRAELLKRLGKYDKAGPLYARAIAIGEKALGPEHPDLAVWLNNRAELLSKQGNFEEADRLYRRALTIAEKVCGPDHPAVATGLKHRARLLRAQVMHDEAIPLLERALKITMNKLGEGHEDTVNTQKWLELVRNEQVALQG